MLVMAICVVIRFCRRNVGTCASLCITAGIMNVMNTLLVLSDVNISGYTVNIDIAASVTTYDSIVVP